MSPCSAELLAFSEQDNPAPVVQHWSTCWVTAGWLRALSIDPELALGFPLQVVQTVLLNPGEGSFHSLCSR